VVAGPGQGRPDAQPEDGRPQGRRAARMSRARGLLLALALVPGAARAAPFAWRAATPESQGLSGKKLEALRAGLAAKNTKALLIIRNDQVVCEWYAPGHSAAKPHYTASLAKALVGGLSLAVALGDRPIALAEPAPKFVP